jgi:hypothetical protein
MGQSRILDLDELQTRPPVRMAIEHARALTDRPIFFKHASEWVSADPGDPDVLESSARVDCEDHEEIYLIDELPELMAVHELLHVILELEGYPNAQLNPSAVLRKSGKEEEFARRCVDFTNLFLHPEIYRRTREVYSLEFAPFRVYAAKVLDDQAAEAIARGEVKFPLGKQAHIFNVRNLLHLRPESDGTLKRYQKTCAATHAFAVSLDEKLAKIGMVTPAAARRAAAIIKDELIAFGRRLGNQPTNDLWRATFWKPLKG